MKFRANIKYSFLQSREAKLMDDEKISGREIEFTFKDLVGYEAEIMGKKILLKPSFTIREIIVPWLQEGNIPEIILE